jgi:hypothetical protein
MLGVVPQGHDDSSENSYRLSAFGALENSALELVGTGGVSAYEFPPVPPSSPDFHSRRRPFEAVQLLIKLAGAPILGC